MAATLETLVKQLEDSGIVTPGKLEDFVPPKAHPKSIDELVSELVKQNHLTRFQAQEVKAGKVTALILGGYTILDKIGAGGMGQVFKAEHRRMKRIVAVKTLPASTMKDAAAIARFQREAEAAARLEHPNIVTAYDADQANGVHFLVMQYIDGQDLSALVKKNGPFSCRKAVNYILQAARGLEFAHGEGVIHRDIKPANLLLDKKGVVKILDVGLARLEAGGDSATQAELTGTGAVMGTVDFMSPEQAINTRYADARADIYSLGCSLYYLLAGKTTYGGETAIEKILAHREKEIPSLREVQADVPQEIEAIFKKMVAKRVEDRYQTMSEVVADLEKCNTGQPTSASIQPATGAVPDNNALTFLKTTIGAKPALRSKAAKKPALSKAIKNRGTLISAGVAALALLLLGLWVTVHDKDGNVVAEVKVPKGGTADVTPIQQQQSEDNQKAGSVSTPLGSPPATVKAPFDANQARAHQETWAEHLGTKVETTNSIGMKMILIPPGEFLMGSSDEQVEAALKMTEEFQFDQVTKDRIQKAERPQHLVVITQPFRLGATEVTLAEFRQFIDATTYVTQAEQFGSGNSSSTMEETDPKKKNTVTSRAPGYPVTDDSAVSQVTWNDACEFCNWLSAQEKFKGCYAADGKGRWVLVPRGNGYRLPTEAEWEYACRAGTTTHYSFGDDVGQLGEYGWFTGNASGNATHTVGPKLPNPFGLYDMHGSMWEWCQDWWDEKWYVQPALKDPQGPPGGTNRLVRGGSWADTPLSTGRRYEATRRPCSGASTSDFASPKFQGQASS